MDYTNKPYSEWIDEAITELFKMEPESIIICARMSDNTFATNYYNCCNSDRVDAIRAMIADCATTWIRLNSGVINELLNKELDEEEGKEEQDD